MLVSVVMPSYNHAKYCVQAAQSVLDQSHERLELIVIDDGSKDESVALLREIDDPRLRIVEQENRGAHAAINRGLEMARGDYLAVINSDDIFDPRRIEMCLRQLDADQADLVCSWIRVVDDDGAEKGIKRGWRNMRPGWASASGDEGYWSGDDFALNLLPSNFVSTTSNMLFRRRVFERIGGMRNLRFAHDWDFMLRVAAEFRCCEVPVPLMNYRIHGSNTISSNRTWMLFEVLWVLAVHLPRFHAAPLFAEVSPESIERQVRLFYNSVHVQGCDKLFWVLMTYLGSRRAAGAPETELLDDARLRQAFIDLIEAE
ncbi:glycosyltransferase family 2 protein [Roseivivax marinus]|uniref:glycosyltransferase family 2 protein n=1 Tax=Roseivivax marinus TaxID=1379903 RepID=UPI00273DCEED|nr:glycosyltransferase [Roseivivax marinus]